MASYTENVSIWWRHHGSSPDEYGQVNHITTLRTKNYNNSRTRHVETRCLFYGLYCYYLAGELGSRAPWSTLRYSLPVKINIASQPCRFCLDISLQLIMPPCQNYLCRSTNKNVQDLFRCKKNVWHVESKHFSQPLKYFIINVNRFKFMNNIRTEVSYH